MTSIQENNGADLLNPVQRHSTCYEAPELTQNFQPTNKFGVTLITTKLLWLHQDALQSFMMHRKTDQPGPTMAQLDTILGQLKITTATTEFTSPQQEVPELGQQ